MRPFATLLIALAVAAVGRADSRVVGLTPRTAQRIEDAVKDADPAAAVDKLQAALRDAGDDLVPVADKPQRWRAARDAIADRVRQTPALRDAYAARVEPDAHRRFDALPPNDRAALLRWLAEFPAARDAAAAAVRLGDADFAAGRFADAARRYREGNADPLRVAAAARGMGESEQPVPDATPTDPVSVRLRAWLAEPHPTSGPAFDDRIAWTTLNGGPYRAGGQPVPFGRVPPSLTLPATYYGRAEVADDGGVRTSPRSSYGQLRTPLGYHPLIAFGHAFLPDAAGVRAIRLNDGRVAGEARWPQRIRRDTLDPAMAFSLTRVGDRFYARFASLYRSGDSATALAALRWDAAAEPLRLTWTVGLPQFQDQFPGPPLADGRTLYAITHRRDAGKRIVGVRAFVDCGPHAEPLWAADVLEQAGDIADTANLHQLTLFAGRLYVATHDGWVVALDAATGRPTWATQYAARARKTDRNHAGDGGPAACVLTGGRALTLVAPADGDRLLAFDADTGELRWQSAEPFEGMQLLGAAAGKAVVTVRGERPGIVAVDLKTGRTVEDWGSRAAGIVGGGRGLVLRDRVLWPTRDAGLQVLHLDGGIGYPSPSFAGLGPANLALGDGVIAAAAADRLLLLTPPTRATVPDVARPAATPPTTADGPAAIRHTAADGWRGVAWSHGTNIGQAGPGGWLIADGNTVHKYAADRRWSHGFADAPTLAASNDTGMALASPSVVGCLTAAGRPRWQTPLSALAPPPPDGWPAPAVASLQWCDRGLLAERSDGWITLLDAATGSVRWRTRAPALGRDGQPGGWLPGGTLTSDTLARGTAGGECLWLALATGEVVARTAGRPHDDLVINPDGWPESWAGSPPERRWLADLPGWTAYGGGTVRTFPTRDQLWAAVPKNVGVEVLSLDPATGRPDPREASVLLPAHPAGSVSVAATPSRLWVVADGRLWSAARPLRDDTTPTGIDLPPHRDATFVQAGGSVHLLLRPFVGPWLWLNAGVPEASPVSIPAPADARVERSSTVATLVSGRAVWWRPLTPPTSPEAASR